jgi:hypothetical protein
MTASTTSAAKGYVAQVVTSPTDKQVVRKKITELISANFQATLGRESDIVNIFMSLIQRESAFNTSSRGINYPQAHIDKILKYSALKTKYAQGTDQERANIKSSAAAFGVCQVTGYYIIKGAGPTGTAELSRLRSDLAGPLLVEPGIDVRTVLLGVDNLNNQLLAGLIVLEGKYKSSYVNNLITKGIFNNRLTASIASYLGVVGAVDGLGTSPEKYANSIIGGSNYRIANNGVSPVGTPLVAGGGTSLPNTTYPNGPAKTVASGDKLSAAGC